jgi:hypothetical protein
MIGTRFARQMMLLQRKFDGSLLNGLDGRLVALRFA